MAGIAQKRRSKAPSAREGCDHHSWLTSGKEAKHNDSRSWLLSGNGIFATRARARMFQGKGGRETHIGPTVHPLYSTQSCVGQLWEHPPSVHHPLSALWIWPHGSQCYPGSHSSRFIQHIEALKKIPPEREWSRMHSLPHIVSCSTLIPHSDPDINTVLATRAAVALPQLWMFKLLTLHNAAF